MEYSTEFEFGEVVRETITGVEGVVVAVSFYHTGCTHVGIVKKGTTKNPTNDAEWLWFDSTRLTKTNKKKMNRVGKKERGGPALAPRSYNNPR